MLSAPKWQIAKPFGRLAFVVGALTAPTTSSGATTIDQNEFMSAGRGSVAKSVGDVSFNERFDFVVGAPATISNSFSLVMPRSRNTRNGSRSNSSPSK